VEAPLQVLALRDELGEALALALDLLLRQRVDRADVLEPAPRPLEPRRELVPLVAFLDGCVTGLLPQRRELGSEARSVDLERGRALAGLRRLAAQLGLRGPEPAKLCSEL